MSTKDLLNTLVIASALAPTSIPSRSYHESGPINPPKNWKKKKKAKRKNARKARKLNRKK